MYIHICLSLFQLMDIWVFFDFLVIINKAVKNIHIQDFTWVYVSVLLQIYLRVEFLGHVVIL